jgi:hypothetical protein
MNLSFNHRLKAWNTNLEVSCIENKGCMVDSLDSLDFPITNTNMSQDFVVFYTMLYDSSKNIDPFVVMTFRDTPPIYPRFYVQVEEH